MQIIENQYFSNAERHVGNADRILALQNWLFSNANQHLIIENQYFSNAVFLRGLRGLGSRVF
jgi:hypothetical protein